VRGHPRAVATPVSGPSAPVGEVTYEFSVFQGEDEVAFGEGADGEAILREANHYAAQYRQDGPVAVYVHKTERTEIWSQIDAGVRQ
jgi:hypothetical protein